MRESWLNVFSLSIKPIVFWLKLLFLGIFSIYGNKQAGYLLLRRISISLYVHIETMGSLICTA